jgi:hypothetical protein
MKHWMANITDDLLARVRSGGRSCSALPPGSGFTGSASDYSATMPTPAPTRSDPMFVSQTQRSSGPDGPDAFTVGHLRYGR